MVSASNLISAPSLVVSSNGSPARVSFSGASVADSLANASTVGMSLVHSVNNILAWQTNLPNGTNSTPLGPSTILKRSVFGDLVGFSLHTDSDPIPLSTVRTPSSSPFSIHVPIPVVQPSAARNIVLTQCVFWDTVHQVWSSAGCALRNTSTDRVAICDCTHLIMFSVQVCVLCWLRCCYLNSQITEFAPRVRTLSSRDFLNLNWDNIKKHPFSLIACSVFWFLYFVALYLAVRRDRQLLSQLKQRQQQPGDDLTTAGVIEMASLSSNTIVDEAQIPLSKSAAEKRDSSVRRCWRWFKQSRVGRSFRNQHLWLSIAFRPSNARLSSQDRLLCVLVLILTSMCCSAIFFGNGSAVHLTSS